MKLLARWSIGLTLLSLPLWFVGPAPTAADAPVPGAVPDFDGDGRPDLAIGGMGAIEVRYGDGRKQRLDHDDLGAAEPYALGNVLLTRDFNGDGYADLALPDRPARALVQVFGGPHGLDAATLHRSPAPTGVGGFGFSIALLTKPTPLLVVGGGLRDGGGGALAAYPLGADGRPKGTPFWITQDSPGVPGKNENGDFFGFSLAAEGAILVVGNPMEDVGKVWNAGSVVVLTYKGGTSFSGIGFDQNSRGVADKAEHGEQFGRFVAIGRGYIAVGVSGERGGSGSIQLFTAAAKPRPLYAIDQNSRGIPGRNEAEDGFGESVAIARLCDGRTGLVVGGPGEEVGGGTGAAWTIPLSRTKACPARMIVEGPGEVLGGSRVKGGSLGSAVTTLRAPNTKADTLALGGNGSGSGADTRVYALTPPYSTGTAVYTGPGLPEGVGLSAPS